MSEEIEVNVRHIEEEPATNPAVQVTEVLRKLLLAGVGAVALSRDEVESFINRLVDRGEIAQKDGEKLLRDTMDRFRQVTSQVTHSLTGSGTEVVPADEAGTAGNGKPAVMNFNIVEQVENTLEQFLNRLNIPSKRDIDELSAKIAQLTTRVEELRRSTEKPAPKAKAPEA